MFENNSAKLSRQSENSVGGLGAVTPRVSEIEGVITKLQNSVAILGEMVSSIESKLEPITRQSSEKGDEVCEPEFDTKVAQEINKAVRSINYLSEKVRDLRERIEL